MPKLIPKADPLVGKIQNMQNHKKSSKKHRKLSVVERMELEQLQIDKRMKNLERVCKGSSDSHEQNIYNALTKDNHNAKFQKNIIRKAVGISMRLEGQA